MLRRLFRSVARPFQAFRPTLEGTLRGIDLNLALLLQQLSLVESTHRQFIQKVRLAQTNCRNKRVDFLLANLNEIVRDLKTVKNLYPFRRFWASIEALRRTLRDFSLEESTRGDKPGLEAFFDSLEKHIQRMKRVDSALDNLIDTFLRSEVVVKRKLLSGVSTEEEDEVIQSLSFLSRTLSEINARATHLQELKEQFETMTTAVYKPRRGARRQAQPASFPAAVHLDLVRMLTSLGLAKRRWEEIMALLENPVRTVYEGTNPG